MVAGRPSGSSSKIIAKSPHRACLPLACLSRLPYCVTARWRNDLVVSTERSPKPCLGALQLVDSDPLTDLEKTDDWNLKNLVVIRFGTKEWDYVFELQATVLPVLE